MAGTPWWQHVILVLLAAGTVALCYLALTRGSSAPENAGGPASGLPSALVSTGTASSSSDATSSPTDQPAGPPEVPDQRRKDFTDGDDTLPDGARTFNTDGNASGMALTPAGLTHGRPVSAGAVGVVETKLDSDVRSLGFRVRFGEDNPGFAALLASDKSVAKALRGGRPTPATSMRLIVSPDDWRLLVGSDAEERVIDQGVFAEQAGPVTFQVVRDGATVWVVDPTGAESKVTDDQVEELEGPWASWGLLETGVDQAPAVIEALWGG